MRRRDIKFTTTTVDGNEQTSVFVTTKTKVGRFLPLPILCYLVKCGR